MTTHPPIPTHPRFISIEGGEGAGKTTLLGALRDALVADGLSVITTREPGGTALGERLRALLLEPSHALLHIETELLLMFAARTQHLHEVITPALNCGKVVLCDRFTDSSYAYQGAGRGLGADKIERLEREFIHLRPGLTLLLDVEVCHGRERACSRPELPDRFESEHDAFFERVRNGFLARATADPVRFRVLDASQPAQTLATEAVGHLREVLPPRPST